MANEDCVIGAQLTERVNALSSRTTDLHNVNEQQWDAINALRNRLPTWATAVATACGGLIGVLVTLLVA